jgi:hypothetical protein
MSHRFEGRIGRRQFNQLVRKPVLVGIDGDTSLRNLAPPFWVYGDLIADLETAGWRRFGAGFKSGVYGHPDMTHCVKLLGMGVGQAPHYFCERGYYIDHERQVLEQCAKQGFSFAPRVLSKEDSVRFLVDKCKVRSAQAELRVGRNDLLVQEVVRGIPFATQTGHHLNYDLHVLACEEDLLHDMMAALHALRTDLRKANETGFLHNDPMPSNIILPPGRTSASGPC